MFQFSDEYIQQLILSIFQGDITEYDLPENLYYSIADYLKKGLYKGYGVSISSLTKQINLKAAEFDLSDLELLSELRTNIYMFSAAKTYSQVKGMTEKLISDKGTIRPFSDFKADAEQIFEQYNDTWLKTEYDTAIGQGTEAVRWNGIEKNKDILPYLRYSAIGDACEICQPLDGLTAPVEDAVWDTVAPLNHFNCLCILEQLDDKEGKEKETDEEERNKTVEDVSGKMNDVFKMNAGRDGYVFKEDHPYFTVPKEDKEFAQKNFDLPIPKHD